ncbi:Uncharacterised protein [BD1-7 clade bacterium]|uniref:Uncharacterized protein n=1 Tax=BD1-7 clade bacterium TaxID=2029982 RepID=A0A5S9PUX9_9GAMM|nr:Uncharacterised protein [BD1-7 clade bacterium]CAA0115538.1 Uncharacterised protein [BD1-7 clade bacterium]CAA0119260.1 Uncharacterised protein [BD1-7 clade bacterium]
MNETALLEIIELADGDVALKPVESEASDSDALVTIRFSDESLDMLGDVKMLVARAMLEAGINAFAEVNTAETHVEHEEKPVQLH